MCCSLQYKDGPRTIVINGFDNITQAVCHAHKNDINEFSLEVKK